MLVYLSDAPALTIFRSKTLRCKLHVELATSPCHRILTVIHSARCSSVKPRAWQGGLSARVHKENNNQTYLLRKVDISKVRHLAGWSSVRPGALQGRRQSNSFQITGMTRPLGPGTWQGGHQTNSFQVTVMTRPVGPGTWMGGHQTNSFQVTVMTRPVGPGTWQGGRGGGHQTNSFQVTVMTRPVGPGTWQAGAGGGGGGSHQTNSFQVTGLSLLLPSQLYFGGSPLW